MSIWEACGLTGSGLPVLGEHEVQYLVHQVSDLEGTQNEKKLEKKHGPIGWGSFLVHVTNLRVIVVRSDRKKALSLHVKNISGAERQSFWFTRKYHMTLSLPSSLEYLFHFDSKKERENTLEAVSKAMKTKMWEQILKKEEEEKKKKEFDVSRAGVGGIMKQKEESSQRRDEVLEVAFQDLEVLMEKAKELVAIAEQFSAKQKRMVSAEEEEGDENAQFQEYLLNMGISSPVTKATSGSLYYTELARQLSDFLQEPLSKQGMLSLTVVYAIYNRARGTDLVSPHDIYYAANLFEKLKLPAQLRKLESGILVVQSADQSDDNLCEKALQLIKERGPLSVLSFSQITNCSVPLATYQLKLAEEKEFICRDESIQGTTYWPNIFKDYQQSKEEEER